MIPSPPELKLTFRTDGVKSPIADRLARRRNTCMNQNQTDLLARMGVCWRLLKLAGLAALTGLLHNLPPNPGSHLQKEDERLRSDLLLWVIEHLFSLFDRCTPIAVSQILRHSHAFPRFLAEPVGAPRVGQALGAGGAGVAGPAPALARLRAEPAVLVAAVPADRLVAELSGGGAIAVVEDSI